MRLKDFYGMIILVQESFNMLDCVDINLCLISCKSPVDEVFLCLARKFNYLLLVLSEAINIVF